MATSAYTPELGDQICEMIATADMSLREVARQLGIPHTNILLWATRDKEFADQYARAREIRDEASMEAMDDLQNEQPQTTRFGVDQGWVQWKRLQVDTRKWQLGKRQPKKYGDRLALEHDVSDNLAERLKEARKSATRAR